MSADDRVREALAHWPTAEGASWRPLGNGLINQTWAVRHPGGDAVLQRVSDIFDPAIHENIRAVTARLAERGIATPSLIPTRQGALFADLRGHGIWRLMTRVAGVSHDAPESPAQAASAASLLARFHRAIEDIDHEWVGVRQGVHDTAAHLATLHRALADHRDHPLYPEVSALADALFQAAERLPAPGPGLRPVPVHGDPKLNNIVFDASGDAACLVDLDTLGPMPLWQELGDAWRSWCNRCPEDGDGSAEFDLRIFEAAARAYLAEAGRAMTFEERSALVHGVEWIALELSVRFAADALQERYFGWDSSSGRFSRAGEHNLLRARGQWSLHCAVVACRPQRADVLASA